MTFGVYGLEYSYLSVPVVTHDPMMGEVVPNIASFDCFTKIVLEMFILKRFFPRKIRQNTLPEITGKN